MAQSAEIFLRKAVCLLSRLVKIRAGGIGAGKIAEVSRAVLCGAVACPQNLAVLTLAAVDGHDSPRCILLAMVCYVDALRVARERRDG